MFNNKIREEFKSKLHDEKIEINDSFSSVMRTFEFVFNKLGYELETIDADIEEVAAYIEDGYEIVDSKDNSVLVAKKIKSNKK